MMLRMDQLNGWKKEERKNVEKRNIEEKYRKWTRRRKNIEWKNIKRKISDGKNIENVYILMREIEHQSTTSFIKK